MTEAAIAISYRLHYSGFEPRQEQEIFTCAHASRTEWGPPSLLYGGFMSLLGSKAARASLRPPTPLRTEIKNKYNYSSIPHLGLLSRLQGNVCPSMM
jgi:hypothetical protein